MKTFLSNLFFTDSIQNLINNTITTANYLSITLAIIVFFIGLYYMSQRKKHGIYILILSFLFLVNPTIIFIFND
jgi:uncharacterized membrane protein